MFPIFSQSLMASSMEPGLLGDGGSAMPVRALLPALERPAEAAPGGPEDTATVVMVWAEVRWGLLAALTNKYF